MVVLALFGRIMPTHNRRRFAFTDYRFHSGACPLCCVSDDASSAIGMLRTILADQGRFDLYSDSFHVVARLSDPVPVSAASR